MSKISAIPVVNLILSIVETQVGSDEHPSPLLMSLVADLKVDAKQVELAQDIVLTSLDVARAISSAVETGNPKAALFQILGLVGTCLPELEQDIAALKTTLK